MELSKGRPWEEIRAQMEGFKREDFAWREGKLPSYIYYYDEHLLSVQREAYGMYLVENGLGKNRAFPSLKRMESEVVSMGLSLLGGNENSAGIFASGGTESIMLAVKAARERAKSVGKAQKPYRILLSETAHPAFNRAAQLMEIEVTRLPMRPNDFRFDLDALRAAIDEHTIMIVGSAPSYPGGTFDPIVEMGKIALENELWLHVDACVGGFLAPFARKNGRPIPDFDLRVPGVVSLSADVHKYGFAAKGASLLLFASEDDKPYAGFTFSWARGTYTSESMQGTRAGGSIACAWAIMNHLGDDGYRHLAKVTTDTIDRFTDGIDRIAGLKVIRPYELCIFSYESTDPAVEINAVGDAMEEYGWFIGRSQRPVPSIQMAVNPVHEKVVDQYLKELAASVEKVRRLGLRGKFNDRTY
ncbi:aminotransferase class V-fold PLP-dependent enzyme [Microvirga sp. VF16]|uniref:pyridoxal phosphate-dependent decarboxylase family protein n=1 Tax=Microvirga sp. VF16 TaxID=2807101 RepID=UPI00193D5D83|nr:aminotransferase class V-fold PLP-dependent enzyme [Microvirga sp. VF16]QRM32889.1 aspartate aminotransferase family protein [Microvirga sp. VF16]